MKRTKRWLAALLSVALLASLLPTTALAGDGTLSDGTSVESENNITRAQLAEMICNKFYSEQSATNQGFTDIGTEQDGLDDPCTDLQWEAINVLVAEGILSGTTSTTFDPDGQVTRAEAAVVLWRATGSKSNPTQVVDVYSDINSTAWYAGAVQALTAAGILTGTGEGEFKPYEPATVMMVNSLLGRCDTANFTGFGTGVTRLEMLMEAYEKYKDSPLAAVTASEVAYDDIGTCTEIEKEAIQFFTTRGVVSGENPVNTGGRRLFSPYAAASNLQVAMFLYRCAVKFEPESTTDLALHAENGTLSSVAISYAIPENAQAQVDAAWAYLEQEIGTEALSTYRSNPGVPAAEGTVISLSEALTPEEPTFDPEAGAYDSEQEVTITCADADAVIYYTVDGSTPTVTEGTLYTNGDLITVSESTTIKAVAVKNSLYSKIASAVYTVDGGSDPVGATYPIYIIGPTGERDSYVDLNENGEVYLIQGDPTTLFDPHDNPDEDIQNQLVNWIYNGWEFTAEKDGQTKTYGPTKYVNDDLKKFLNPLIAQGWTLTMNSRDCGQWVGRYPITIIGPTGEMNSYVDLDEKGEVHLIQGNPTTLFDPRTNSDTAIQEQLRYWVYNGWEFTAEKDGETITYGPTKYVNNELKEFLNPLIADHWTLTMNSKSCGYYDYPDSGSSGGSSSSGSSGNKTETTTNSDGSTTTTVTGSNGTVTETTKYPDGSREVVETKKNGTVTTTTTDSAGNKTEVVESPDGSAEITVSIIDGSSSVTTVREDGTVKASVKLPAKVIEDAADSDAAVVLPMPAVPVTKDAAAAASVTVDLPAGRSARVEIPVEDVTAGTVAVMVKADGTEQVIKTSTVTENGVAVTVSNGDTMKIVDNSKDFADVPSTYWASAAIDFATSRELFAGTSETTFTPAAPMTRVMIVTVLARYASDGSSLVIGYAEGQQWAVETGISDGSNMSGTVTRQQLAAMLYRYAGSPAVTGSLGSFPDAAGVSDDAADAMIWAVENGLITGRTAGTLNPYGLATRAQVATILQRFVVSFAE